MGNDNHPEMEYATFPGDQNGWGASGALAKIDSAKSGMGGTIVYFISEEINAGLARVEAAGGKIIRSKQDISDYGFIALIHGTEGNMIGLHSMK